MDYNNELEEILKSIQKRNAENEETRPEEAETVLEPPQPPVPPVPSVQEQETLVWFEPEEETPQSPKEKRRIQFSFQAIKNNFKTRFVPKLKAGLNKLFTKQIAIIALVVVLVAGAVFGGVKAYRYSKVAYLKPYEQQYHIAYPTGILEEFCDAYGKDQSVAGAITISDTDTKMLVSSGSNHGYALLCKGSDVFHDQHFRAIALNRESADLESVYATPSSFLHSTQRVSFDTLFEKADYKVIAAYYTNADPEDDGGYLFPYNAYGNMTVKSFQEYRTRLTTRSLYSTGYTLQYGDDCLSLSVDSDFMENFKFVVVCVKTEHFEPSDQAEPNTNIHYPRVWYDKNKEHNSFRFAGKWYPEIYVGENQTKQLTIDDFIS